jgi:hypothetical protein
MRESAKKELVKEATESHAKKKNWSRKQLNHYPEEEMVKK